MRYAIPALLVALFALSTPAEARGRNGDSIYTSTYPRCGTYGCVARHDRAARVGVRDRGPRERSFRSSYSRSRSRY